MWELTKTRDCRHSRRPVLCIGAALLMLGLLFPLPALAACSFSSFSAIVFGNYDVFNNAPLDTVGTVAYRCGQTDHNITIVLDTGGASSFANRRMLNGSEPLYYNIYLDAARTMIWGDGSGGSKSYFIKNPQPNNADSTIQIYGRIPAGQSVSTGIFANQLTVTMIF